MNGYGIRREKFFSNFPQVVKLMTLIHSQSRYLGANLFCRFPPNLPSLVKGGAIDTAPGTDWGVFLLPWRRSLDVLVLDHLLASEIVREVLTILHVLVRESQCMKLRKAMNLNLNLNNYWDVV
ncbi:hypothetical protein CDAR_448581 [Caerostris darwini]|uniref:Uncharacterized protein n=1 Tax=Caerostris darwini TaxID=1538125 RepID=A0AAV4QNY3_9ARAC|nr:hypothetical protein CDAR_448581 [Caerostris darwini]